MAQQSLTSDNYFVSRQPVYDSKVGVTAYELSFSASAIYSMFTDAALDQIAGEHPSIIRITPQALEQDRWKSVPSGRIVLGYFDPLDPASSVAAKLAEAASAGYRIALSDSPEAIQTFGDRAFVIKIDVTKHLPNELQKRVRELKPLKVRLLADHVDTYDDLEFAKSLGFDFYKGLFLYKPAALKSELPVNRLSMIRLLASLQRADLTMPELEQLISQDVTLSYKLLRYSNSPVVGLSRNVTSIGHAARMVGMDVIRNWASALLLSNVEDKPRELMNSALVRARMCEGLAEAIHDPNREAFVSAGLLSVLDALLDCRIDQALAELPLSDDIKRGIVNREGAIGQALRCAVAYEQAQWDDVRFYGLPLAPIHESYMTALSWARALTASL